MNPFVSQSRHAQTNASKLDEKQSSNFEN
jgi:hypothetical protein